MEPVNFADPYSRKHGEKKNFDNAHEPQNGFIDERKLQ